MIPLHIPNACQACAAPLEPWTRWPGMYRCSVGCDGVYPDWDEARWDELDRVVKVPLRTLR